MGDVADKKQIDCTDFPPTAEAENVKAWDINALNIEMSLTPHTMTIELTTEALYESRCYKGITQQNIELKILSKIEKKTKLVTFIMKTNTATFIPAGGKKLSVEEYKNAVKAIEGEIKEFYDVKNVTVISGDKMLKVAKPIIDRNKERLEREAYASNKTDKRNP